MRFIDEASGINEQTARLLKLQALDGVRIVKYQTCQHRFHETCIASWKAHGNESYQSCPMCRLK